MFCLIFGKRAGELVRAGSVGSAFDAFERFDNFVQRAILNEFCYSLQIAAATADEFNVRDLAVLRNVKQNLSAASSFRIVRFHIDYASLSERKTNPRGSRTR